MDGDTIESSLATETKRYLIRMSHLENASARDWQTWLELSVPDFNGNYENAGLYLQSLDKGASWLYSQLGRKLKSGASRVPIGVEVSNALLGDIGFSFDRKGNRLIVIKQNFLEHCSRFAPDALITVYTASWEVGFRGKISSYFEIVGVEEAHHSVFQEQGKLIGSPLDPRQVNMKTYQAKDVEYRALRWTYKYAKEQEMGPETISVLSSQLTEAALERKSA